MGDIVRFTESTVGELDSKLKDVRIPRANLGPCPVCGHDIVENRKGFSCWSREDPGCGFVIWKSKAGKNLPAAVARERARLRGQIKIYTAQGRVTGFVLCAMPFVMFGLLSAVNWQFERLLLTEDLGRILIYVGLGLMLLGVLIIRKIIDVKV